MAQKRSTGFFFCVTKSNIEVKYIISVAQNTTFDISSQVSIHREGHAQLSKIVEELERKNLEIMSEMFDCKVEDLKFTRLVS